MEILIKASQFLLSLSFLIVLHEFGHYLPAKLFKTRVEKFYLFFDAWGKKLFSFKKGGTEYGIGWLPLGGYVKISGMIDESMDTEQMKQPAQPWEFRSKPAWQRLIIMLGGVIVNFILGFLIYIMVLAVWGEEQVKPNDVKYGFSVDNTFEEYGFKDGDLILKINGETPDDVYTKVNKHLFLRDVSTIEVKHTDGTTEIINIPENIGEIMWQNGVMTPFTPRMIAVIDTVIANKPAQKAGFKKNDQVVAVNGNPITYWNEFTDCVDYGKTMQVDVMRNGTVEKLTVTPNSENKIGIGPQAKLEDIVTINQKKYTFAESIPAGFSKAYWTLRDYITQFKYVFTKKGAQSVGGFIAIGSIFPSTWSWQAFWGITAFLSIMLGFMNLLPIPALDGGHVMFTLWEMITGKKPSDKFLEYAQIAGFVLLMGLLLLANGNDIYKLFSGS
ncbi:RIP metalloprotease RseP [Urechidicola croceus]|uniref:Zinc metalloprotease n=1 Tax=Urechidicola croceus TaxID=1850246 RepID=A0A1D8P8P1_9FLAO|nr:RIP metalloprotease RseP [Urechidicola croceus]AOW20920.1 RIP metalloprotease RseP [Urechidicola croceus]